MTEYCRLCAELRDFSEIVTTIFDMENKLRACCQWTPENTDRRLPSSVCAICSDKLDKFWLFSQSVQWAQQKLQEIFESEPETKPLVSEMQTVYDSVEQSDNLPPAIAFEIQNSITETANFQCTICHKSFKSNRSLLEHFKQHYENKCEICSLKFCTVAELNDHRQLGCEGLIEIKSNAEECKLSAENWNLKYYSDDNNDGDAVVENDDFDDKKPIKYFKSVSAARKALQKKRSRVKVTRLLGDSRWQHKCDACGLSFSKQTNLSRHQAKHDGIIPFECYKCHKTFQFRYLLINHFKNVHPLTESELQEFALRKGVEKRKKRAQIHKCQNCNRSYTKRCYLTRHRRQKHMGVGHYECWLCHKMYLYKYALKYHLEIHLREELNHAEEAKVVRVEPVDLKKIQHKCCICGKIFRKKWQLKKHRVLHSNELPFECFLCHKRLKTPNLLKKHIKVHLPKKKKKEECICELCGKVFTNVCFLEEHLSTHSDQRRHKCGICGLGYKTKRLLNSHHISHTEFQHKCTQCGKSFRKKASLRIHMESHTGLIIKPFVCDVCGKAFRKNVDAVEHRRIHTGEKPYNCEYCGLNFRTMSGCYTHLKKVHGVSVSARNRQEQIRLTAIS